MGEVVARKFLHRLFCLFVKLQPALPSPPFSATQIVNFDRATTRPISCFKGSILWTLLSRITQDY